ncbi:MAG: CpXC domain-containing protein [Anaerolineaceae bacterium]|nr:CpXC domain-containing protein [Anaerolineaceae bacterium]
MPKTTTSCPRCHQPVVADIEQLFDTNVDPKAKQLLLSGNFNLIRCPNCGYQGNLSTPIVYHDPSKELLLTYFPPDLGMQVNEQERLIGPFINQVTNKLPPEKRKAYLLRPQNMLTFDTLLEKILEADGITKDMIQAQQQRLSLLQRLLSAAPDSRGEIIRQEESLIDSDFFNILSRLAESSMAQGDEQAGAVLAALQQQLLNETKFGKDMQSQAKEAEEAVKSLQEASQQGLTREKLLDLIIDAPTETRLSTLVSLTRSGLDYTFFQILGERIEKAGDEQKQKLTGLRDKLLAMTQQIDQAIQQQMEQTKAALDSILSAPNLDEALAQNLDIIDEYFMEIVQQELQAARQQGNLERSGKLQRIQQLIEQLTTPPPEIEFIKELLGATDAAERQQLMEHNQDKVTPEMLQMLNNVIVQSETQNQPPEVLQQLQEVYRAALRFSMQANMK